MSDRTQIAFVKTLLLIIGLFLFGLLVVVSKAILDNWNWGVALSWMAGTIILGGIFTLFWVTTEDSHGPSSTGPTGPSLTKPRV